MANPLARPNPNGHAIITLQGNDYYANKLASLFIENRWSTHRIVHLDGDRQNLAFGNLREYTPKKDEVGTRKLTNAKSWGATKVLGVYYDRHCGRYTWRLQRNGKSYKGSGFHTAEAAKLARENLIISLDTKE